LSKKILIVDDEKDLVATVSFRLESRGYTVAAAYNGMDALEKVKREKPDLIILDLMLPKMDGYRVCALLKKNAHYSAIPIIIFTARAEESDVALTKEAGADAYITKPFDPDVLLAKIKELLKEGQ